MSIFEALIFRAGDLLMRRGWVPEAGARDGCELAGVAVESAAVEVGPWLPERDGP